MRRARIEGATAWAANSCPLTFTAKRRSQLSSLISQKGTPLRWAAALLTRISMGPSSSSVRRTIVPTASRLDTSQPTTMARLPSFPDPARHLLGHAVLGRIVNCYVRAGRGQGQGDGTPYSARRSGDKRDLGFQPRVRSDRGHSRLPMLRPRARSCGRAQATQMSRLSIESGDRTSWPVSVTSTMSSKPYLFFTSEIGKRPWW